MKIQARYVESGDFMKIEGVKGMTRLRTDKAGASKRPGWLLMEKEGMSFLFDDIAIVTHIEEEDG